MAGPAQYGMAQAGMVWAGPSWPSTAWLDVAWQSHLPLSLAVCCLALTDPILARSSPGPAAPPYILYPNEAAFERC